MDLLNLDFTPDVIVRPVMACVLGAMLGWDRELKGRPAGLRTQILVSLGACVFTLTAMDLHQTVDHRQDGGGSDPIRVIGGIVGGIGFLGAGSIIQSGGAVQGVTTAATVWVCGAIGIACGLGAFPLAIVTTALTAFVLIGLGWVEKLFGKPNDSE